MKNLIWDCFCSLMFRIVMRSLRRFEGGIAEIVGKNW